LGFEGVERVVMMIDALGEFVGGGWGRLGPDPQERQKKKNKEQLEELVLSHPSRKRRGLDGAPRF